MYRTSTFLRRGFDVVLTAQPSERRGCEQVGWSYSSPSSSSSSSLLRLHRHVMGDLYLLHSFLFFEAL